MPDRKPPMLPPCYQPEYVSGACPACGATMQPAHYQAALERLTCAACCNVCRPPEPLPDGPVVTVQGTQEALF